MGYVLNINRYRGSVEETKTQKERPPSRENASRQMQNHLQRDSRKWSERNFSNRLRSEDSEHKQSSPITSQPLSENKAEHHYNSYTIIGLQESPAVPINQNKTKNPANSEKGRPSRLSIQSDDAR